MGPISYRRIPTQVALLLLVAAVGGLAVSGCASGGEGAVQVTWPKCYSLTEGDTVATIRLEPRDGMGEPDAGQLTIFSTVAGEEEFPPETTVGRLTQGTFVYADGTTLTFDDRQLSWPVDSLLEGAEFEASPCP